jgi:hypothetical protein
MNLITSGLKSKKCPKAKVVTKLWNESEGLNPDNSVNDASLETLEHRSEAETADKMSLADQLKTLACSVDEDGLYIVRGLIANDRIKETRAKAPGLVDAIVSPKVRFPPPSRKPTKPR